MFLGIIGTYVLPQRLDQYPESEIADTEIQGNYEAAFCESGH
jgi:hypothetical protein